MGDMPSEDKGKAFEDLQSMDRGEVEPAENCYIAANFVADRRILARLERELQTVFMFENRNGWPVSSLWVVSILLGRILRERTTLGRATKQYAKFQQLEIMRCMVKLNDLEDMAEPPLYGVPEASALAPRQHEGMETDAEAGRRAGAPGNAQFSPDDDNLGPV